MRLRQTTGRAPLEVEHHDRSATTRNGLGAGDGDCNHARNVRVVLNQGMARRVHRSGGYQSKLCRVVTDAEVKRLERVCRFNQEREANSRRFAV